MKDFKIFEAKNLLGVTAYAPIRGFRPPSLMILGKQLDKTKEVLYNGIQATEYVIQSPDRVIVKIPESQVGRPLTDLKLLSTELINADSLISLQLGSPVSNVSGLSRLVQTWLMVFFTTPGSNLFNNTSGGGGNSLIGRTTDPGGGAISSDLTLVVERTQSEVLRSQASNSAIPLEERLLSSSISSIQFDPESTVLFARVVIQNMAGQSTELTIN